MNALEIYLPRRIANQLWSLAQQSPDQEICGLIAADASGHPRTCYPIANSAGDPRANFLLDPAQHLAAQRLIRENGQTLFAVYHSHPATPATPSAADLAQAGEADLIHLIISLSTKGVLELRGYRYHEDQAQELTLRLVEQTEPANEHDA